MILVLLVVTIVCWTLVFGLLAVIGIYELRVRLENRAHPPLDHNKEGV